MIVATVFIVLVVALETVIAFPVECRFETHSDGYNCEILNAFAEENLPMTETKGAHKGLKNDSNVEVLFMRSNLNTKFLPIQSCLYLKKLTKFDIGSRYLRQVSRNIFEGCFLVDTIEISETQVTSLPEDLFVDLVNLTTLDMHGNPIVYLPEKLFAANVKLRKISFESNRLAIINAILPSTLIRLSFRKNICIDKNYPSDYATISQLNSALQNNCSVSIFEQEKLDLKLQIGRLEADVLACNKSSKLLKIAIEKQETEQSKALLNSRSQSLAMDKLQSYFTAAIASFHNDLRKMQTNLTLMSIENSEKTKEIQVLTSNHSTAQEKIEQVFAEVVQLRQNISLTASQLADKSKSLEACAVDKSQINGTVQKLKGDLMSLKTEKDSEALKNLQLKKETDKQIEKLTIKLAEAQQDLKNLQSIETTNAPFTLLSKFDDTQREEDSFAIISWSLLAFLSLGWIATVVFFVRRSNVFHHSDLDMEALTSSE